MTYLELLAECDKKTAIIKSLDNHVVSLKEQVKIKDAALRNKNLNLDAMAFVWCSGGCKSGVYRWADKVLTQEIVDEANRNTRRLNLYWNILISRTESKES